MGSKGNRAMKAKLRKSKNRNRFARFSGATSKHAGNKYTEYVLRDGDLGPDGHKVKLADDEARTIVKEVYVGPVRFTNQVVNVGRGPNAERMQEYYQRVRPESYLEEIEKMRGMTEPFREKIQFFIRIRQARPKETRVLLVNEELYKIEAFYTQSECYLLRMDLKHQRFSISRDYGSMRIAKSRLLGNRVVWKYSI